MSDNWIIFIPEDPAFVPTSDRQKQARELLKLMAPDAEHVESRVFEEIVFFDCCGNFERVSCPTCLKEIPADWWKGQMNEDYRNGFALRMRSTPCCGSSLTLNDLVYEMPQGFGKYALSAMNPNIHLCSRSSAALEDALGTKLRMICRRL